MSWPRCSLPRPTACNTSVAPLGSPLRPLLRWTSLVAGAVILAVLGGARMHLHNFVLFLGIVIALAIAIVTVFVLTADGTGSAAEGSEPTRTDAG